MDDTKSSSNIKNGKLITALRQLSPTLTVGVLAVLRHGCEEYGQGSGEFMGFPFEQCYRTLWNDGMLVIDSSDGFTLGELTGILSNKTIRELSHEDLRLRSGSLKNGSTEYATLWKGGTPDNAPEDSDLYSLMNSTESEYRWLWPKFVEIEVHYLDETGEDCTLSFLLGDDE